MRYDSLSYLSFCWCLICFPVSKIDSRMSQNFCMSSSVRSILASLIMTMMHKIIFRTAHVSHLTNSGDRDGVPQEDERRDPLPIRCHRIRCSITRIRESDSRSAGALIENLGEVRQTGPQSNTSDSKECFRKRHMDRIS